LGIRLTSLRRSQKGVSTIYAEAIMIAIVIVLSTIVFIWVVPVIQTNTSGQDNTGAAYYEKFGTLQGQYATFVQSTPETVRTSPSPQTPYVTCSASSPITSSTSSNIFVPPDAVCVITVSVGNVFVSPNANLTVVGGTVNRDIDANYSASVTLRSAHVAGFIGLFNVQTVNISSSFINTSGIGRCTDVCGAAMYAGGRGSFSMTNNIVTGQIENEVGHQTYFIGNQISGRLEVESADFGQLINNTVTLLDLDQNGVLVISGNTVNGNVLYGTNGWCGTGNNKITGSTSGSCVGNVEVDILNTGSIPVKLVAVYMDNIPLAGDLSWSLASGGLVQCGNTQSLTCAQLPIVIPVGQMARVTMGWTPPPGTFALPWTYIYFTFVSSHSNFVDGYLYFNGGLALPSTSRPENRVCPPCN
jgi:hypothetical protein